MLLSSLLAPAPAGAAPADDPGLEADFVAGINAVRSRSGLPGLEVHPELTVVAEGWSAAMAGQNGISHNPNVGGQVSAPWVLIGENVGAGYDVPTLMQAFVDSASHLHNLVEPDYDWVGVGVTWGSDGRLYTAHVFM
ncbi:MAG: CAP domain-containing protein, partial [Acidimicrobiia bacterium]|nr:CAP domain-containing protein [Acidimicrobiia bacterium]